MVNEIWPMVDAKLLKRRLSSLRSGRCGALTIKPIFVRSENLSLLDPNLAMEFEGLRVSKALTTVDQISWQLIAPLC